MNPKPIHPLMLLLPATLLLAACGSRPNPLPLNPSGPAGEITFYHPYDSLHPDIFSLFEDETGLIIGEAYYTTPEEMAARLANGPTGYALVAIPDLQVYSLLKAGLLAPLDSQKIPGLANLTARFRTPPYDPGNAFCIPFQWTTTGLAYDPATVSAPESWAVLFNPVPGAPTYQRATMLDNAREGFAAALLYLGYDIDTTLENQLAEARAILLNARTGLSGYNSLTQNDLLAGGVNSLAHTQSGTLPPALEANPTLQFTVPREGGVIHTENLCIPSTATPDQKLVAETFLDFLLRPEISAMAATYARTATTNTAAEKLLPPAFLTDTAIYPPATVLDKLHFLEPLGQFDEVYQRLWNEVKSTP